jgi:hypothetical protein
MGTLDNLLIPRVCLLMLVEAAAGNIAAVKALMVKPAEGGAALSGLQ